MRLAVGAAGLAALVAACTGDPAPTAPSPSRSSAPTVSATTAAPVAAEPTFTVLAGADGVAILDGGRVERVTALPKNVSAFSGPLAAPLPGGRSAVVVAGDHIAVVGPGRAPLDEDCDECSGVAVRGDTIVTTRANHSPGEGFDIVTFGLDLSPHPAVRAERLEEEAKDDVVAENTESPVTLAASADGVTVGYLSRNGSVRAGPTILAQYDDAGRLVRSSSVTGGLGPAAVSPDGRRLALGVGGSSGACANEYALALVDLATLRTTEVQPTVPAAAVDDDAEGDPWFELTDVAWAGNSAVATGFVHTPPATDVSDGCEARPTTWRRSVDPTAGAPEDQRTQVAYAARRWVGPACNDAVEILRDQAGRGDLTVEKSGEALGHYDRMRFGPPTPVTCPA